MPWALLASTALPHKELFLLKFILISGGLGAGRIELHIPPSPPPPMIRTKSGPNLPLLTPSGRMREQREKKEHLPNSCLSLWNETGPQTALGIPKVAFDKPGLHP